MIHGYTNGDLVYILGRVNNSMIRIHYLNGETNYADVNIDELISSINSGSLEVENEYAILGEIRDIPKIGFHHNMMVATRVVISYFEPRYSMDCIDTEGVEKRIPFENLEDISVNGKQWIWNLGIKKLAYTGKYDTCLLRKGNIAYRIILNRSLVIPDEAFDTRQCIYDHGNPEENSRHLAKARLVYGSNNELAISGFVNRLKETDNVKMQLDIYNKIDMDEDLDYTHKRKENYEIVDKDCKISKELVNMLGKKSVAVINFMLAVGENHKVYVRDKDREVEPAEESITFYADHNVADEATGSGEQSIRTTLYIKYVKDYPETGAGTIKVQLDTEIDGDRSKENILGIRVYGAVFNEVLLRMGGFNKQLKNPSDLSDLLKNHSINNTAEPDYKEGFETVMYVDGERLMQDITYELNDTIITGTIPVGIEKIPGNKVIILRYNMMDQSIIKYVDDDDEQADKEKMSATVRNLMEIVDIRSIVDVYPYETWTKDEDILKLMRDTLEILAHN